MIVEAIVNAFIGTIVERGAAAVLNARAGTAQVAVQVEPGTAAEFLKDHLRSVERWSSQISFRDLPRSKGMMESFVELEAHAGQGPSNEEIVTREPRRLVTSLLMGNQHVVILGRPGAGKTTSIQRLALTALQGFSQSHSSVPIVLRLRDLRSADSVLGRLASILGLGVMATLAAGAGQVPPESVRGTQRKALTAYLDGINALLFIDGLDECLPALRDQVEQDINDLMMHARAHRIILTCRRADYGFDFPAQSYTLLPLSSDQVRQFAAKWLGPARAAVFDEQLARSPFRGAEVVPITIAHLCAIFERRGEIPPQPRFIYQKLVRLLLEEWDEQRGIRRTSRYSGFEVDQKLEFLRRIAYELTLMDNGGSFTHDQLEHAYLHSFEPFGLPQAEYSRVAREIESHSGLILQSSHDRYEFAHKSIQEFLTAEYLLRLPAVPRAYILMLAEELSIAAALSSRGDLYIESIAVNLFQTPHSHDRMRFAGAFLSRLMAERPNLPADAGLGWILLALWMAGTRSDGNSPVPLGRLASNESTGGAVHAALAEGSPERAKTGAMVLHPPYFRQLPAPVSSYIASLPDRGIRFPENPPEALPAQTSS